MILNERIVLNEKSRFEEIVILVRESREPILYSFILNDFFLIEFKYGHIIFFCEKNQQIIDKFKLFLIEKTGIAWSFELSELKNTYNFAFESWIFYNSSKENNLKDILSELKTNFSELQVYDLD
ncbi:hypothetical protein [Candidatus Gromoviella agglomerans]|uniref:hypothetical protein n=1 Tax=Candidatus Gromoviella agglomerans TaxID=2806609 RepID=UPI001E468F00|nr:hypothetical protein [Candidatus Gromoviella agglomerans]UFX98603.1 DNA polymerase III subunit gamma/tau C-terminal domain protein [Candidatus Gromoviella agglomerans]